MEGKKIFWFLMYIFWYIFFFCISCRFWLRGKRRFGSMKVIRRKRERMNEILRRRRKRRRREEEEEEERAGRTYN